MNIRLQNPLALIGAIVVHVVFFAIPAPVLKLGKNTPPLVLPIRVRAVAAEVAQVSLPSIGRTTELTPSHDENISSHSVPTTVVDGSVDRDQQIYTDIRDRYFRPDELDSRPTVVTPPDLGESKIGPTREGDATVRFFINESGSVDRMEIEASTLPDEMLEQLQLQRENLYFKPGRKQGVDVKSVVQYKIHLARVPTVMLETSGAR